MVRETGLEPVRPKSLGFKPSVSACSTTWAFAVTLATKSRNRVGSPVLEVILPRVNRVCTSSTIQKQEAVEMIDLVLDCPRLECIRGDDDFNSTAWHPAPHREASCPLYVSSEVRNG